MSNLIESTDLLRRYTIARIPFIAVNTIEKDRCLEILKRIAADLQLSFYVSSLSSGIYDLTSGKHLDDDTTFYGAVMYMTEQMRRKQYLTLVLSEVPDLSTDNADAKQLLAMANLANQNGGSIIVISDNPVWDQLQRLGMTVKLDLPDEEEMYMIIRSYIDDYRNSIPIEWDNNDVREAASTLVGATKIEAENVIAALLANNCIRKSDMDEVRHAKDRLFSDISVRSKGLRPPRGILLVGVPGCGKSMSAKSISANWKLPLYRLDFATVQGSYVGQSEQQLRKALATAEEVAPCILWIDEIEKGLSGATAGAGDGGVSTRMVGQFLFWLQECRKNVFVVATANDVSMLPSELLRRGRFDELFFVDLPTAEERRQILSLYMRKYLSVRFEGAVADKIVEMTDGFTGADLESTVRDLTYRQICGNGFILNEQNIINAFDNVVPLSQTSPEKIEAIREWGKERAVPASGIPIGSDKLKEKSSGPRLRRVLLSTGN